MSNQKQEFKTKNQELKELWDEFQQDESVKLTQYQLALIFEKGEHYCRKLYEERATNINEMPLSDLRILESELDDLVDGSRLSNGELDSEGLMYNSKLMRVHGVIEKRVKLHCDSIII